MKRPAGGYDHSPPSSAQVKNGWSYTSVTLICPHGVDRDKITFNIKMHLMSGRMNPSCGRDIKQTARMWAESSKTSDVRDMAVRF